MEMKLDDIREFLEECSEEKNILFKQEQIERDFIINLVRIRKSKGFSQTKLAKESGLTQQAISSIEKYNRKPTLSNLIKYLFGLGIDINDLFKHI